VRAAHRGLRKLWRRPVDTAYQEIMGQWVVEYVHDGKPWRVLVKFRDYAGFADSGRYVKLEKVSGVDFETLQAARESMRTHRGETFEVIHPMIRP